MNAFDADDGMPKIRLGIKTEARPLIGQKENKTLRPNSERIPQTNGDLRTQETKRCNNTRIPQ